MVYTIDGRPCGSYVKQKNRITRKELEALSTHITNYKKLTMDELCQKLRKISGGRPCSSRGREKNRITRAELMQLAANIEGHRDMTMDQLCSRLGFRPVPPRKRVAVPPRKAPSPRKRVAVPRKRKTPKPKKVVTPCKEPIKNVVPSKVPREGFVFKYEDPENNYTDILTCSKKLGGGGYGNVYQCLSKKLNKDVALKVLRGKSDKTRREVERELTFLKAITPYKIYSGLSEGDKHFLVTEFIDGPNTYDYMNHITVNQVLKLADYSLEILSRAHSKNIAHLDIKPENFIIIPSKNQFYLVDWGVSCFIDDKKKYACDPKLGTEYYISPWLNGMIKGVKCKNGDEFKRNDLWALGITLQELATHGNMPKVRKTKTGYSLSLKSTGNAQLDKIIKQLLDLSKPCLTIKDLI